jgi:hypothetical protein
VRHGNEDTFREMLRIKRSVVRRAAHARPAQTAVYRFYTTPLSGSVPAM